MTISYKWLKDYLDCDLTAEQVCEALTSIGLEVDSLEMVEQIPGGLAGVVVAEVLDCEAHPNSDHLHITHVNAGQGEPLQVVCGAPNVAAGQKVLLATIGTVLGKDFKISKSKIRGVESFGMICAEDELGIGEDHSGIMVLRQDAVPGTPAKEYLGLETDALIEIGLTANRVDAASHIGVARDLYAYLKYKGQRCALNIPDVKAFKEGEGEAIGVSVEAPAACPRYSATTIKGVKIGPSPDWMQKRLMSIGLRPINNIVDITNFVLMESGQPMHAFDMSQIDGGRIIVRMAKEGEPFRTLDGVDRTLSANDLVIANANAPMCLAGVFGGEKSGVSGTTTDVVIESAYFAPAVIRKTSKRHNLKTDAAFRYERGADPLIVPWAARRAALLIEEIAGGKVCGKIQEDYPEEISRKKIELDYARIEAFIGKKIGAGVIETILENLGYEFVSKRCDATGAPEGATVAAPSYMIDVYRECDVVEEILRIYGYDNVEMPSSVKMSVTHSEGPDPEAVRNGISDFLAANGFVETMNNSLTKEEYYSSCKTFPAEKAVRILNPLSSDLNVMRQTLIFNGLEVISYNIHRQSPSLRIFEYGSVYSLKEGTDGKVIDNYSEHQNFALFMTGSTDKVWRMDARKGDYFALKGYLELLLRRFGVDIYTLPTSNAPSDIFSEGVGYMIPGSNAPLAVIGTIAPAVARKFDIRQSVYAAEISWPALFELVKRVHVKYQELPRFPEVRRDLAVLLDENVSYSDIRRSCFRAGKKMIKSITLFDVYRGDKIPQGKKQYALNFVLQDADKTLVDADVEKIMSKILSTLQNEYGAVLR